MANSGIAPPLGPPPNETLEQFLDRRENELLARVSALRGQLNPAEAELAQIQQMKAVIAGGTPGALSGANLLLPQRNHNSPLAQTLGVVPPPPADLSGLAGLNSFSPLSTGTGVGYPALSAVNPRFATATIKELVIQALLDGFPNGATTAQIRDFIRSGYGREIQPSSLRPQMHRLKADGVLRQDLSTDTWNFTDARKRSLYAMYDHPTSRRAMKELQDEQLVQDAEGNTLNPGDPEYMMRLAESLAWRDEGEQIKPPAPDEQAKPPAKSAKERYEEKKAQQRKAGGFLDD